MIAYLIKSGLCLAFLLGFYLLLLEREKMHRFNRFFLLFALVFGLSVPLFTIDLGFEKTLPNFNWTEQPQATISPVDQTSMPVTNPQPKEWPVKEAGFILYGIVTTVLFIRFTRSLMELIRNIQASPHAYHHGSKLVLCKENVVPHSFMGYIFLNETKFRNGTIEEEIIEHERVHVQQMHSLDILSAELLKIVFWFNPIFYFYKKAIQLNHEFIADDIVTQQTRDISAYQKILLQHSSKHPSLVLASSFNYSLTKKRFVMMKKKNDPKRTFFKQLFLIPIIGLAVVAFSNHATAQDSTAATKTDTIQPPPPPTERMQFPEMTTKENKLLDEAVALYQKLYKEYMSIDPETTTLKDLELAFEKVKEAAENINKVFKEITGGEMIPTPLKLGPDPEYRKLINSSEVLELKSKMDEALQSLRQKWKAYLNIKPIKSNLENLEAAYKTAMETQEKFGEAQTAYYNFIDQQTPPLPPIPQNPQERIGNN